MLLAIFVINLYYTWAFDAGIDVEKAPKVEVRVSQGWIRGYEFKVETGTTNVFKKVPFISPPLGDLRFHSPLPSKSWDGVLDATKPSPACPQNQTDMDEHTLKTLGYQDEDCVYMNIYADNRCNKYNPCPVVFYIHGGGNVFDDPIMFNDTLIVKNYASRGLVWIIPSYRHGILGWMDIGDPSEDSPYNNGFLDIFAAFRWTQREVYAFGGNRRDIVMLGHSSGAQLATFMLSSPALEANAFSRALILSPGGRILDHMNRPRSMYVAEQVGCLFDDKLEILNSTQRLKCLRTKTFRELTDSALGVETKRPEDLVGPQEDGITMTQRSVYDLSKQWRPMKLFLGIVSYEGDFDVGYHDQDVCYTYMPFVCPGRLIECERKCRAAFGPPHPIPIGGSYMHAFTWLLGHINTVKGGESWYHVFDQYHGDVHADELAFAFGLHAHKQFHARNVGHQIMKRFFPRLLLRFMLNKTMVEDWEPMDNHGRNYFYNNIKAIGSPDNYTIITKPHYVRGEIFHQTAVDFWWKDLAQLHQHDSLYSTTPAPPIDVIVESTGVPWYIFLIVIVITLVLAIALLVIIAVSFIWKARRVYESENNTRDDSNSNVNSNVNVNGKGPEE